MPRKEEFHRVTIEYPSAGATYSRDQYGVYGYGTYPRSSVLAGRTSRVYLGSYDTLEEAKAAHPEAVWTGEGSQYVEPNLNDLPGDDDPDPLGDDRSAFEDGMREAYDFWGTP
jgi:hypothetical protein